MVRSWIEFHDSHLDAIVASGEGVCVYLTAYVHRWETRDGEWVGTGWMQPVTITVSNVTTPVLELDKTVDVWNGTVHVNEMAHDNLVPLPFEATGSVRVVVELVTGVVIEITGDQVRLAATGDARFVENKPARLRPSELQP